MMRSPSPRPPSTAPPRAGTARGTPARAAVAVWSGLRLAAALAALGGLAGCPIPQPVAEVVRVDGGSATVTPPRIVTESATPSATALLVRRGCPGGAAVTLGATIRDDNTIEQVEARWFVDYDQERVGGAQPYHVDVVPPPADVNQTDRPLPPLALPLPASDPAPGHVVDVVISNGFYALDDPTAPVRNKSAQPGYETQLYRWAIEYVDAPAGACTYP